MTRLTVSTRWRILKAFAMNKKIHLEKNHRLNDLTSVAQTVHPLAKQLLGEQGFLLVDLLSDWRNIVGATLAELTLPRRITFRKGERGNGSLELLAFNGAAAMEIQQRTPQIIEKINTYFGYAALSGLKIIQSSIPENFRSSKNPLENMKKNLVTAEEEIYITGIVKDVNNEDLRRRLECLGKAVLNSRKD